MPRPVRVIPSALLATGLTAALTVSLLASAPAQARTDQQSWSVPSSAVLTVHGRGYGHGKGMSQYGAEGAARQGLGYRQIVSFYYPGTAWGTAKQQVRVLISAATARRLVVLARPGLKVRDLGAKKTRKLPANRAKRWRLVPLAKGRTRVDFKKKGSWRTWRTLAGEAQFAAGGKPITLRTPAGLRAYRGKLRSVAARTGAKARQTVNVLSLEKYLRGVVPQEMPATWSPAAVQAQAVAARTYAAHQLQDPKARHYQICDTTLCQVYGGVQAEHPAATKAIKATKGVVLTSAGKPAFTQFSSSNGGHSAPGSFGYLAAREDPYDGWSGNPNHQWQVQITDRTVEKQWPALGDLTEIRIIERDGYGQWSGRVRRMQLIGSKGTVALTGDEFRFALGLKSTWLTIALD